MYNDVACFSPNTPPSPLPPSLFMGFFFLGGYLLCFPLFLLSCPDNFFPPECQYLNMKWRATVITTPQLERVKVSLAIKDGSTRTAKKFSFPSPFLWRDKPGEFAFLFRCPRGESREGGTEIESCRCRL